MNKDIDVLVVGSINIDLNAVVSKLPLRGQTIHALNFSTAGGGKGANQAVAAARLGARVAMIGAIGRDEYAEPLRLSLEREGIDCSGVISVDGPSGLALITIEDGGQNTIVVVPGANGLVSPEVVRNNSNLFARSKVVLIQLEIPLDSVHAALKIAKEYNVFSILNPAPAYQLSPEILSLVNLITPNETEATLLSNQGNPIEAASFFHNQGISDVLITLGEKGCLFSTSSTAKSYSSFKVKALDATAAGDSFNGAVAVSLARGTSWEDTIRFASAVGALCVTKIGAQPSLPTAQEVQLFLSQQV